MWILLEKPKFDHFIKNQFIGPLMSFRMFRKFMKDACVIKFIILMKYYQGLNAVL